MWGSSGFTHGSSDPLIAVQSPHGFSQAHVGTTANAIECLIDSHRLQLFIDRMFRCDSPELNKILSPIFEKWRGMTIFKADALLLAEEACRHCYSGQASSFTMSFPEVEGFSRFLAKYVESALPRDFLTGNLGVLEFPESSSLDLVTEIAFSLGAFGASTVSCSEDTGRFVPLLVSDSLAFKDWLDNKFSNSTFLLTPQPIFHFFSAAAADPRHWVFPSDVKIEVDRLEKLRLRRHIEEIEYGRRR